MRLSKNQGFACTSDFVIKKAAKVGAQTGDFRCQGPYGGRAERLGDETLRPDRAKLRKSRRETAQDRARCTQDRARGAQVRAKAAQSEF